MKILLHVCCAPCSTYVLTKLRKKNIHCSGYFYNPNIHPYREFKKRLDTVKHFAQNKKFDLTIDSTYGLTEYLQKVVFHENERCKICYRMRLEKTAQQAVKMGVDGFTTTLLYSKYQNHTFIAEICKEIALSNGIEFYYEDFREGWQEGIDSAIEMNLYRQAYCGCIYSEQERYDKNWRKLHKIK